jgi:hypothetical protein
LSLHRISSDGVVPEKYSDENVQNSSCWDKQDRLLYGQIFGRGESESAQVFREISAGEDVEQTSKLRIGRFHMGNTYSAGQVGAMGPAAIASNMTFQQVWTYCKGCVRFEELAKELSALRTGMKWEVREPEHGISIGAVAAAGAAAKTGDGPKTLEYLKHAGTWAFDVAIKIGVNIASLNFERNSRTAVTVLDLPLNNRLETDLRTARLAGRACSAFTLGSKLRLSKG